MRNLSSGILLLSILLLAPATILQAQDTHYLPTDGDKPGELSEDMPGIGTLLPLQEMLSTEDNLSTEGGATNPPFPGDIPVDGGLSLLMAAGAAYGVRRVRRSDRKKEGA